MNIAKKNIVASIAVALVLVIFMALSVSAANTPTLNQTINPGTLNTDVLNGSRVPVASPAAAFSAKTFSFDCQYGGTASTGTLGSGTERVYVINPNAANNGWTLAIAATGGITTLWQNTGSTQNYDFNDPTGANPGCTDGADIDSKPGQLTIDPAASTINLDCLTCTSSNVTKPSSAAFNQGTVDSVTLLNAALASDDIWRGYLTGVGLSQTIPAEQPADSYTLNMTVTVTAN